MPSLRINAGPPVRLRVPGRLGATNFQQVSSLVLARVRALVHFEIGIYDGKTLAFVTVQPHTDYTADDAMRELHKIAQDLNVDGPAPEQVAG